MNKKYYIAPYSTMAKSFLESFKEKNNDNFLGYIDSVKEGENIYKVDEILLSEYDYIYIISPNHRIIIHQYFNKKGIKNSFIKHFNYKDNCFVEESYYLLLFNENMKKLFLSFQKKLHNYKYLFEKNDHILLLAPEFIDINIKAFYLYLKNSTNFKVSIATNNKEQYKTFKDSGFSIVFYPSFSFLLKSLFSKYKILDHSPVHDEVLISLSNSFTIQIWHGITIKRLGHMADYKKVEYDLMISTSSFVSEYSFSKLFDYKKIINAGYPRNDILINGVLDNKELVMANKDIYSFIKKSKQKVVIYMPTWRPYSHIKNPIDLDDLNIFAKKNDFIFVIKLHPFTRSDNFYSSTFDETKYVFVKNYEENIVFYPTTDDIYPLLSLSDLLITDYSSIYFDYLLVDKPILFFIYDKDVYLKEHGDFMLDYDKYTPGKKVVNFIEFKEGILNSFYEDIYKQSRKILKNKLFESEDGKSCEIIFEEIKKANL